MITLHKPIINPSPRSRIYFIPFLALFFPTCSYFWNLSMATLCFTAQPLLLTMISFLTTPAPTLGGAHSLIFDPNIKLTPKKFEKITFVSGNNQNTKHGVFAAIIFADIEVIERAS